MKVAFIQKKPDCSLGYMYIASALKHEAECQVFIEAFEYDLLDAVEKYNPDILAFSAFTGDYKDLLLINQQIKKRRNILSLFGGPHPTYNPELILEDGVDGICRGEGERAMLDLVKALKKGEDYYKINNFYFKNKNTEIIKNDLRDLNNDIDSYAFPDRNIYSKYFHIKDFKNNIIKRVISGRGCPFSCTYCFNHALRKIYANKGNYVRVRSVKNTIDELAAIKTEYDPVDFDFVDDIFGMEYNWLTEFSAEYKKNINLPFSCLSHLNFINEEYVSFLKEAACKLVSIGIETGSETFRIKILKRNYGNDQIYKATDILHKYGLCFYTFNILLLPGETLALALKTLKVNLRCRPFGSEVLLYQPFPGTDLASYAAHKGYYDSVLKLIPDNLFTSSVLINKQKKLIIRLFHLFQFVAKFRYFYPLARILIYFPFDRFYEKIHKRYKEEMRKRYSFNLTNLEKRLTFWDFLRAYAKKADEENFLNFSASKRSLM